MNYTYRPPVEGLSRRRALAQVAAGGLAAAVAPHLAFAGTQRRQILLYIGSHAPQVSGALLDPASGRITGLGKLAGLERPTWAVRHPTRDLVYYADETGNDGERSGSVATFAFDRASGALAPQGKIETGGGGTTHLCLDAPSRTMFTANYGGGTVTSLPLAQDGKLLPPSAIVAHAGSGPNPRQKSPHPHGVTVDPSGHWVLAPDLGADRVFIHRLDRPRQRLVTDARPKALAVPPGSGPRHLVFAPSARFAYLSCELAAQVLCLAWDARQGVLSPIGKVETSLPGFTGQRSVAELVLSANGRFLYVSNRGEHVIVVYAIDPAQGIPREVQRLASGGEVPWHMALSPDERWLVVANMASNRVSVFARDPGSGRLVATPYTLDTPEPVYILPIA